MTNREKYAEQILDIACSGTRIAVKKNVMEPVPCSDISCKYCYLRLKKGSRCDDACKEWCESEYVEPQIDWSKVPVDTPIQVRNSEKNSWNNRYFAKYENNRVYAWIFGANSWSSFNSYSNTNAWNYAKLAEDGDKNEME